MMYEISENEIGLGQVLNRDFIVTAQSLNIRKQPTTKSQIVGNLKKDEVVRIFSRQGNWGSTVNGWVSMSYLREAGGSGSGNATQTRGSGSGNATQTRGSGSGNATQTYGSGSGNATQSDTTLNRLPSWIPENFRTSIERATNWIRQQVIRIFGKDEKEVERMLQNLTIQYEAVERLVRSGKVKADSILVRTQKEVADFLANMKAQAEKLNRRGVNGLEAVPVTGVVVLVAGLAAGVITLQTIQRMRQVEVQRESELRKFKEYQDFKKSSGTSKSTFEALLNSTAQPKEESSNSGSLFAGIGSGLQNLATIALLGAGGFVIYNLIQSKK